MVGTGNCPPRDGEVSSEVGVSRGFCHTASTRPRDAVPERAVRAQRAVAADAQRRAAVEAKNQAESLLHSAEKSLEDYGDKVSEEDRAAISAAIEDLKAEVEKPEADAEAIKIANKDGWVPVDCRSGINAAARTAEAVCVWGAIEEATRYGPRSIATEAVDFRIIGQFERRVIEKF